MRYLSKRQRFQNDNYIYFMRRRLTGRIKIGTTINLVARAEKNRYEYGMMDLLGVIKAPRAKEKEIHALFSEFRIQGKTNKRNGYVHDLELFDPDASIYEYINKWCVWDDKCDKAQDQLTRRIRQQASSNRAKKVHSLLKEGYTVSQIAESYDIEQHLVKYVLSNKDIVNLLKI